MHYLFSNLLEKSSKPRVIWDENLARKTTIHAETAFRKQAEK
jgi:hypothetical protein